MENRSLSLAAGLALAGCFLSASSGWAQSSDPAKPTPEQRADWASRLEQAKELQKKGTEQKQAAKEVFEARRKECFKRFRVTDCQDKAKQQYVQTTNEARRIENEGKAQERQVKKEELEDNDARREAQEPERQAERQAREADIEAEREKSEASREKKLADKEAKARAGAERHAAAEERLRKKRERHEKKLAEGMEKARQREAEAER